MIGNSLSARIVVAAMLSILYIIGVPGDMQAQVSPPGDQRDQLTMGELLREAPVSLGLVHNDYFMPIGDFAPALHAFSGVLSVPEIEMQITFTYEPSHLWFPKVDLAFVSHGDHLIPVERDIIRRTGDKSYWDIILSPGRVWSEASDAGLSRASFPFVLSGSVWNESHNGIATFVYDDASVSSLQFQIVQEAADWNRFNAWGRLPARFTPDLIDSRQAVVADFEEELAQRLEVRPWTELEAKHGVETLAVFSNWGMTKHLTTSGLIVDDVIYLRPCETSFGDYPYCREMRHGVFSVTKTVGALLSMLRLAQKYGDGVFDLRIMDYVDVTADHAGWEDVRFSDALNMVTGVGDKSKNSQSIDTNEDDVDVYLRFAETLPAQDKLRVAFSGGNYPWGPGEVFRYRSIDTFVLAAAMDAFLKSKEGPDANLWDMMLDEVLRPIGVHYAPMLHTEEADGSRGIPILGGGIYPTVDDVAKIANLLQNGGHYGGQQLLSASKLEEALYHTEVRGKSTRIYIGRFAFDYYMSLWHLRLVLGDCQVNVPNMLGFGGNIVQLLPNGMATFYFEDGGGRYYVNHVNLARAANEIRPLCSRYAAAQSLVVTVSDLIVTLKEGEFFARLNAAKTLSGFGPVAEGAVPALIEALADEEETMRKEAVITLGKIGPGAKAAVPALTAMQHESLVGYYALEALKEITGK